jgi:hypothetical protein
VGVADVEGESGGGLGPDRKAVADLVSGLTNGKLRQQAAELATLPRAAVVLEERYSALLKQDHVPSSMVLEALAELAVRVPTVPVVFAETRKLAQEWTYRFLGAALVHVAEEREAVGPLLALPSAGPLAGPPAPAVPAAAIRDWAASAGFDVAERGRIPAAVRLAYDRAHA